MSDPNDHENMAVIRERGREVLRSIGFHIQDDSINFSEFALDNGGIDIHFDLDIVIDDNGNDNRHMLPAWMRSMIQEMIGAEEEEIPPTFPATVLEPDLDDAFFSDTFSNLNTGIPMKPRVSKTDIPPQTETARDNKASRLRVNELLRDSIAKAREINDKLRALNAMMRERLGE